MNEQQLYAMFLQWLPTAIPELKGATPEQVHGVVQKMAQSQEGKQKLAQLIQVMQKQLSTQSYQRGGTFNRFNARRNKRLRANLHEYALGVGGSDWPLRDYGKQGLLVAKGMATDGFNSTDFDPMREFNRKDFRARKQEARDMGFTDRRQIKAYAVSEKGRIPLESKNIDLSNEINAQNSDWREGTPEPIRIDPIKDFTPATKSTEVKETPVKKPIKTQTPVVPSIVEKVPNALAYKQAATKDLGKGPLRPEYQSAPSQHEVMTEHAKNGTLGMSFSSVGNIQQPAATTNVKSTASVKPAVTKPAPARAPLAAAANTSIPYSSTSGYVTPTTQKPPLARAQATSTPTKSNSVWSKIGNFLGKLKNSVLR